MVFLILIERLARRARISIELLTALRPVNSNIGRLLAFLRDEFVDRIFVDKDDARAFGETH